MKRIDFPVTDKQNSNIPLWLRESFIWHNFSSLYTQPFNPFAIISTDNDEVFFFTQTFAQLCNIHPSSRLIPKRTLLSIDPKLYSITFGSDSYKVIASSENISLSSITGNCVDDITHELRTGSLLMDLSSYLLRNTENLDSEVIERFHRAASRQKILSIVSSDFIELLLGSPMIHPVSLYEILRRSLKYLQTSPNTRINIVSSSEADLFDQSTTETWGSSHVPLNILSTLLAWLYGVPLTLEIEIINEFSMGISFNLPNNFLITNHQGYPLIVHYLQFMTCYFNYRSWITQNAINIVFPRILKPK